STDAPFPNSGAEKRGSVAEVATTGGSFANSTASVGAESASSCSFAGGGERGSAPGSSGGFSHARPNTMRPADARNSEPESPELNRGLRPVSLFASAIVPPCRKMPQEARRCCPHLKKAPQAGHEQAAPSPFRGVFCERCFVYARSAR